VLFYDGLATAARFASGLGLVAGARLEPGRGRAPFLFRLQTISQWQL